MVDLRKMLEAGVHFGHRTSRWSPKMKSFIWGAKNKIHLIDVSKTALLLERAAAFIKEVSSMGGKVLFVGTKKAAQPVILNASKKTGMPYIVHRWVGGTLSNHEQVKKAVTRLLHMKDVMTKGVTGYKKKEISMIQKEIARLEKNVGGIVDFDYPPAALIVVDAKKEHSAIKEASRLKIPVIALVDTNTDPEGVDFIIPSNDDSPRAIEFVMDYLTQAVIDGAAAFEANKKSLRNEEASAKAALDKNRPALTKEAKPAEEIQEAAAADDTVNATEDGAKKAPARKKAVAK